MVNVQLIVILIERDLRTLASIGNTVEQWESGARLVVVRSSPTGALGTIELLSNWRVKNFPSVLKLVTQEYLAVGIVKRSVSVFVM